MNQHIETQLHHLGLSLPPIAAPAANYVPYVIYNDLVYISGQLPLYEGSIKYTGPVTPATLETGKRAAALCALNVLAQLKAACEGDFSRVIRCIRLGGFVNCAADFDQPSLVLNDVSDLMVKLFDEQGRHARAVIGASALPLNAMVEVEAIFALRSMTK